MESTFDKLCDDIIALIMTFMPNYLDVNRFMRSSTTFYRCGKWVKCMNGGFYDRVLRSRIYSFDAIHDCKLCLSYRSNKILHPTSLTNEFALELGTSNDCFDIRDIWFGIAVTLLISLSETLSKQIESFVHAYQAAGEIPLIAYNTSHPRLLCLEIHPSCVFYSSLDSPFPRGSAVLYSRRIHSGKMIEQIDQYARRRTHVYATAVVAIDTTNATSTTNTTNTINIRRFNTNHLPTFIVKKLHLRSVKKLT